jgi:hypothetical protein
MKNIFEYFRISKEENMQTESELVRKVKILEESINQRGFNKADVEQQFQEVFKQLLKLYGTVALKLYRRKRHSESQA